MLFWSPLLLILVLGQKSGAIEKSIYDVLDSIKSSKESLNSRQATKNQNENESTLWIDQNGQSFNLSRYKGQSLLVFIGYTSCPALCPMITGQMKKLEDRLNTNQISSEKLQILFITIDEGDTAETLKVYAHKHHLDLKRWTLAQAPKETKDRLLGILQLSYEQTKSNNHLRHSFSLVVINSQGHIVQTFPNLLKLDFSQIPLAPFK